MKYFLNSLKPGATFIASGGTLFLTMYNEQVRILKPIKEKIPEPSISSQRKKIFPPLDLEKYTLLGVYLSISL